MIIIIQSPTNRDDLHKIKQEGIQQEKLDL